MINAVVLAGRLTKDPEMRYTDSGKAVTNFSIAVDRAFGRGEDGEKVTDFFDIVCWEKTAELAAQYLTKGAKVGVTGRAQVNRWTTDEGQKRQRVEFVCNQLSFLESKAEREQREEEAEHE